MNNILAFDPSFTAWGWAVIDDAGNVLEAGCIQTKSESKKREIRKGDDRVRRVQEILSILQEIMDKYKPAVIVSEQPHGSQSATAAVMIGITTGMIQTIGQFTGTAVEWFSEGDCKARLMGSRSVEKSKIIERIKDFYPDVPFKKVKYYDEAVADAMAVYHLAKHVSPTLKFLNRKK